MTDHRWVRLSKADYWIRLGRRGLSSETIFEVMSGNLILPHYHAGSRPQDASDFERCSALLALMPEWRERLQEVADKYPSWQPLVTHWSELEALLEEERFNESGEAPKLYNRIQELLEEAV